MKYAETTWRIETPRGGLCAFFPRRLLSRSMLSTSLAICGELSDGTLGTRPNAVSVYLREALLPTQLLALAIAVIIYSITSIYHSMSFLARLYAKAPCFRA